MKELLWISNFRFLHSINIRSIISNIFFHLCIQLSSEIFIFIFKSFTLGVFISYLWMVKKFLKCGSLKLQAFTSLTPVGQLSWVSLVWRLSQGCNQISSGATIISRVAWNSIGGFQIHSWFLWLLAGLQGLSLHPLFFSHLLFLFFLGDNLNVPITETSGFLVFCYSKR